MGLIAGVAARESFVGIKTDNGGIKHGHETGGRITREVLRARRGGGTVRNMYGGKGSTQAGSMRSRF